MCACTCECVPMCTHAGARMQQSAGEMQVGSSLTASPKMQNTCTGRPLPAGVCSLTILGGVILSSLLLLEGCLWRRDYMLCGPVHLSSGANQMSPIHPPQPRPQMYPRCSPAPQHPLDAKIWCFAIRKISPVVPQPPYSSPKALI